MQAQTRVTFHGGNFTKDFHNHVRKRLGITAAPLTNRVETLNGPKMNNEVRIRACSKQIINTIKIPGFIYKPGWLITEMNRRGFSPNETESSIEFLIDRGVLKGTTEGVQLNQV